VQRIDTATPHPSETAALANHYREVLGTGESLCREVIRLTREGNAHRGGYDRAAQEHAKVAVVESARKSNPGLGYLA
jgi:hypothetical protein